MYSGAHVCVGQTDHVLKSQSTPVLKCRGPRDSTVVVRLSLGAVYRGAMCQEQTGDRLVCHWGAPTESLINAKTGRCPTKTGDGAGA